MKASFIRITTHKKILIKISARAADSAKMAS